MIDSERRSLEEEKAMFTPEVADQTIQIMICINVIYKPQPLYIRSGIQTYHLYTSSLHNDYYLLV